MQWVENIHAVTTLTIPYSWLCAELVLLPTLHRLLYLEVTEPMSMQNHTNVQCTPWLVLLILIILGRCYHQVGRALTRGISCTAVLMLPMTYYPWYWFDLWVPVPLHCPTGGLYYSPIAWSCLTVTHTKKQPNTQNENTPPRKTRFWIQTVRKMILTLHKMSIRINQFGPSRCNYFWKFTTEQLNLL